MEMAESLSKKSPVEILLERKVSDLKTAINSLKPGDPVRVRKEAGLKQVEGELAAFSVK